MEILDLDKYNLKEEETVLKIHLFVVYHA